MAETPCFEELFSNLISNLKESDKVIEVSSHFGAHISLEDMFSYLWELEETNLCLLPNIVHPQKSDEDAERLRVEGNKCYQKRFLDKALKLYNLSIMSAPHPELKYGNGISTSNNGSTLDDQKQFEVGSGCDEKDFRSLALGYANRSAVLLELKQYVTCINDIDLALDYGYPKLLHSKLAERKAKCLISLGKRDMADVVIKDALKELDDLQLDEAKSKASRDALAKLHQQCESKGKSVNEQDNCSNEALSLKLTKATKEELLFAYQTPKPPVLPEHNPAIPCLSSAVKLAFSPTQGRYLIAERDINPGELLVVEEGYSKVLHLDSSLRTHCSVCLNRCHSPLPCPSCSRVIFCSASCRTKGLSLCHGQECGILPTLAALDMGKNAVLAFRILIQTTFPQLKKFVPLCKQEVLECPSDMLGFNHESEPLYDSSDYRTIYHLVTNKEHRSVSDLFKRCAMAVVLTWLLKESQKYFINKPSKEDLVFVGCTLLLHMMNLPCNAHSITELQVDVTNFQKSSSQEIGSGAFGVLSLTNHSCNPSAARFSYGNVVALRAIRFIRKGSEVTDSYGEHYGLKPPTQRKSVLLQQYYFTCMCEPCENNWPTYLNLSAKHKLICVNCKSKLDSKGRCSNCKLASKENAEEIICTPKDIGKQIELGIKAYESAYDRIIQGDDSTENGDNLCRIISLIDKYVEQPCRTYFEAQETLKHYFDRQGACVFRKEC